MARFCKECGAPLKDGVKFCESCGAAVDGGANNGASNPQAGNGQARPNMTQQFQTNRNAAPNQGMYQQGMPPQGRGPVPQGRGPVPPQGMYQQGPQQYQGAPKKSSGGAIAIVLIIAAGAVTALLMFFNSQLGKDLIAKMKGGKTEVVNPNSSIGGNIVSSIISSIDDDKDNGKTGKEDTQKTSQDNTGKTSQDNNGKTDSASSAKPSGNTGNNDKVNNEYDWPDEIFGMNLPKPKGVDDATYITKNDSIFILTNHNMSYEEYCDYCEVISKLSEFEADPKYSKIDKKADPSGSYVFYGEYGDDYTIAVLWNKDNRDNGFFFQVMKDD